MSRRNGWKALITASLVILAACGNAETSIPTIAQLGTSPVDAPMDTPAPDATPAPESPFPDPDPGMANVYGRVLWNEEPVPDQGLLMCKTIILLEGCEGGGPEYESRTGDDGMYSFLNILPGSYQLVVESYEGDQWLYITAEPDPVHPSFQVSADQTLHIPDFPIIIYDVVLIYPAEGDRIDDARPTLEWAPYNEAEFFNVYITLPSGEVIASGEGLQTHRFTPSDDLPNCEYGWQVEVFNYLGNKIAEHRGYYHFTVYGQPTSC